MSKTDFPEGFKVIDEEKDKLYGEYKGYFVEIDRDKDTQNWFYIRVYNDGGYLYDGWWEESGYSTLGEAVKEAIEGAQL